MLFRLGGDRAIDPIRRVAAQILSFYQRAPIHILADAVWGEFDWMMSSLLRCALLRLCRRRAHYWLGQAGTKLPSSGWPGSLFVAAIWLGLVVAVYQVFPILPDALIR
ncbi:hypothetical protein C8J47_1807 [Sphingomonas sp. PP-F2F-G114-C0414]|uniref:hypothetical protein n=1 Tax=Sphingomonas sp. PP-F2F-G114-C0414 TaxID=2135662 RepID=UPI000EF896EC|nr:hypothetical protein [Sphingomonas sp. PP-F2F-G114-C0414]RMB36271.1 hypothetical protein C8J47_1807 [Sphingomonas sp. PP-F2F-G114-C0414]